MAEGLAKHRLHVKARRAIVALSSLGKLRDILGHARNQQEPSHTLALEGRAALRFPPVPGLLVAATSIQGGAALAKSLFPALGAAGTTGVRVAFAALILLAMMLRQQKAGQLIAPPAGPQIPRPPRAPKRPSALEDHYQPVMPGELGRRG